MAIDLYNRSRADRSLEAFVVHMMMAWLYARTADLPVIYVAVRVCEGHPGSAHAIACSRQSAGPRLRWSRRHPNDICAHVLPHRKPELTKATSQRHCP
jgi:hypothetical protein